MDVQVFIDLQDRLDLESTLREDVKDAIKELNKTCRLASAKLAKAHSVPKSQTREIIDAVAPSFQAIRKCISTLVGLVEPVAFYKYHDMWSNAVQNACALVVFAVYLDHARLATPEDIQEFLGCRVNTENNDIAEFVITLEEYLHALISLFSELSRLAVNSVIVNDIQRPQEISTFASDLYSGFQLLNLKNDSLRRRFDSIKYDIKKIEEVQYDLRVRGLIV
ncbi:Translin-1 [Coemansia thaxteri]|uniref:Translin-1 n=1 Tax=Coemansia thaxteri TaxID=2663907 RepID=A0A9W8BE73_9FUNG|nr:Translin-1 [Coemansia thaxteri]KAJ2004426.1 Translin-1 [Coemansia thaxteri]KAJ2466662.1 Translin-1 [Coemansia sp. RSA 2322]KAJ2485136.1 Translin-1 [Coemansia sp. RSA 2320]